MIIFGSVVATFTEPLAGREYAADEDSLGKVLHREYYLQCRDIFTSVITYESDWLEDKSHCAGQSGMGTCTYNAHSRAVLVVRSQSYTTTKNARRNPDIR